MLLTMRLCKSHISKRTHSTEPEAETTCLIHLDIAFELADCAISADPQLSRGVRIRRNRELQKHTSSATVVINLSS